MLCLFQQLYNTVDTMIVGNVLGDTCLLYTSFPLGVHLGEDFAQGAYLGAGVIPQGQQAGVRDG